MDTSIKQKRIEFSRRQFQMLGKNSEGIELAVNELNNALFKKRQVVIIKKWSEFRSELKSEPASEFWSALGLEIRSEIRSEFRSELGSEIGFELGSKIGSEFGFEIRSEFRFEFGSKFRLEIRSELGSEIGSEIVFEVFDYFENNWILFINEFYPQLKALQKNKKKIEAIKKIVEAGNAYIWISKKKLYVLPFPEVHLDERKRFHNLNGYALKLVGKETYWINGVKFDKELWEKIVRKELSALEIIKLQNQEQKIIALKIYGWDKVLDELKPQILDSKKLFIDGKVLEHQVLEVKRNKWTGRFLKYVCPSTGRQGILRVDHNDDKTKTVEGSRDYGFRPLLHFLKADASEFISES